MALLNPPRESSRTIDEHNLQEMQFINEIDDLGLMSVAIDYEDLGALQVEPLQCVALYSPLGNGL